MYDNRPVHGILVVFGSLVSVALGSDILVDYTVAEVDGTVVTRSELVAEARLTLLRGYGPSVARTAELTPELLSALLEVVVHRKLLLAELRRLQLEQVPPGTLEKARDVLRSRFSGPQEQAAFWVAVGLARPTETYDRTAPPALEAILREEIAVDLFVDVRIRAGIVLDEQAVVRCIEANSQIFSGKPLDQTRARVRARLREQHEQEALSRLLGQLKRRADLRYPTSLKPVAGERKEPMFSCPLRP